MNLRDLVPWSRNERQTGLPTQSAPINSVTTLHREVNRLFDEVFRGFGNPFSMSSGGHWPSIDVDEDDRVYTVTAELPGLEERDVEILLQDGTLTLRGEKKLESVSRDRAYNERYYGHFERQIKLDRHIDANSVSAKFRNGVLTIVVPKTARGREKMKRIVVATETPTATS